MRTRRCYLDIETFPLTGRAWGPKWETSLIRIDKPITLASFAWKFDDTPVQCIALPDVGSQSALVKALWKVFDEAQIIVAHNGKAFDIKQSNAFFLTNHLTPPSPYVVVDTKTEAKRYFKFPSNSLDDLGQFLGVGKKEATGGIDLWWGCEANEPEAWRKMKKYNKQDVVLLEKIYTTMLPWMRIHPNLNVYEDRVKSCRNCLSQRLQSRGKQVLRNGHALRYVCNDCGAWNQGAFVKHETLIK